MEKRAVLAIVLSLVVVVLWSIFFALGPPPPPSDVSAPAPSSSAPGQRGATPSRDELTASASQPEGTVAFRGDLGNGRTVHRLYRFHHTNYTFEISTWVEGLQSPAGSSMLLLWGPGLLRHTHDV